MKYLVKRCKCKGDPIFFCVFVCVRVYQVCVARPSPVSSLWRQGVCLPGFPPPRQRCGGGRPFSGALTVSAAGQRQE